MVHLSGGVANTRRSKFRTRPHVNLGSGSRRIEEEAAFRAYMRAWYQLNHGDDVRRDVADAGFEEGGAGDDDDDIYG